MKLNARNSQSKSEHALTLTELVVILGVLALAALLLAVISLPFLARAASRAQRVNCVNNLKQMGLGFRTWALDNNGDYPMDRTSFDGTLSLYFVVMSNELSTPKILRCPQDTNRVMAAYFTNLTDMNLSYFLSFNAIETKPYLLLCGDRNLTNPPSAGSRFINVTKSTALGWNQDLHSGRGNLLFADGSVSSFTNGSAATATAAMPDGETNRLAIP